MPSVGDGCSSITQPYQAGTVVISSDFEKNYSFASSLFHSQAAQYVENGVQGPSSLYRKFQLEMPLLLHPRILSTLSLASHTCGIDGPACVLPVFPESLSLFSLGVNGRRMAEL